MACYAPKPVTLPKNKGQPIKLEPIGSSKDNKQFLNQNWKWQDMIPCKKCIGCKIDNAKQWGARIYLETKDTKNNIFLTLTYNNDNLPKNEKGIPSIKEKDWTTFINTLRKKFERKGEKGIKYIVASEYGSKTARPHFHAIIMNINLTDIKKTRIKSSKTKLPLLESETINKIWNKGGAYFGTVTNESACYIAGYTIKGQQDTNYEELGINPQKIRMSNGIGKKYFEKNKDEIYKNDNLIIKTKNGTKVIRPPKYYDRLLEKSQPKKLELIKKKRLELAKKRTEEELRIKKMNWVQNQTEKQKEKWKRIQNKKIL